MAKSLGMVERNFRHRDIWRCVLVFGTCRVVLFLAYSRVESLPLPARRLSCRDVIRAGYLRIALLQFAGLQWLAGSVNEWPGGNQHQLERLIAVTQLLGTYFQWKARVAVGLFTDRHQALRQNRSGRFRDGRRHLRNARREAASSRSCSYQLFWPVSPAEV